MNGNSKFTYNEGNKGLVLSIIVSWIYSFCCLSTMYFLFSNRVTYVYNLKSTYVHQRCHMSYLDTLYCHILLANMFVIVIISFKGRCNVHIFCLIKLLQLYWAHGKKVQWIHSIIFLSILKKSHIINEML